MAVRAKSEVSTELLTSHQVAEKLSVCVRTVWRLAALGKIPQPIRYTRKLVRWRNADIMRYLASLR
jgi:predicted DNA-binding transcriptional regulator AlpA